MFVLYIKSFLFVGAVFNVLGVFEEDMLRYCNFAWQRIIQGGYVSEYIVMVQYMFMQYRECQFDFFEYIVKIVVQFIVIVEYVRFVLAGVMFCYIILDMSGQYLGYMVVIFIIVYVVGVVYDKDNLRWKRVDISGAFILFLFRNLFKQWVCIVKRVMEKFCVVGVFDL